MPFRLQCSNARSRTQAPRARWLPIVCMLVVGFFSLPFAALAQGKDDLWDVTVKMEMPGMPMAMPAQTYRSCVAKNGNDDAYVPKQDNCKVVESKRVGNKQTFKTICTGKDPMEMTGEITYGSGIYDGRTKMKGRMEGEAVEMTQTFSGKRIGDCTAAVK